MILKLLCPVFTNWYKTISERCQQNKLHTQQQVQIFRFEVVKQTAADQPTRVCQNNQSSSSSHITRKKGDEGNQGT